jgi:hypothetical protein
MQKDPKNTKTTEQLYSILMSAYDVKLNTTQIAPLAEEWFAHAPRTPKNCAMIELIRATRAREESKLIMNKILLDTLELDISLSEMARRTGLSRQRIHQIKRKKIYLGIRNSNNRPVSYGTAHKHIQQEHGHASDWLCAAQCGKQAYDWAYCNDATNEITESGGPDNGRRYSTNTDDYVPLCRKCHRKFDNTFS